MKLVVQNELMAQLLGLLAVATVVVWGTLSSDKQLDKFMPETRVFPSIANRKPSGMSAMYDLCQRVFKPRQVDEWDYPYRKLKGSRAIKPHGVLVIVGPDESLADFEVKEIADWVEKGNYLLYLDDFQYRSSKRLLELMHLGARELDKAIDNEASDPRLSQDAPLYQHLRTMTVSARQALSGGKTVASVKEKPILIEKKWGKGSVLIGSCPQLASNRLISKVEYWSNYQFLCNWLSTTDGAIMFDEKCHGSTRGVNVVFFFLHGPTGLVILQIGLILAIAILSANQRFGALTVVRNNRRISNLEHIDGLSGTYFRAQARPAVLSIIWASVRLKLCKALQINPHDDGQKLSEALLKQDLPDSAGNLPVLVQRIETAIERKNMDDDELKELVAACDNIARQADGLLTTNKV